MSGFGCPCFTDENKTGHGWDCIITFDGEPILHGQRRKVAFHFLSGDEARAAILLSGRFFLWQGGFIGEAVCCEVWRQGEGSFDGAARTLFDYHRIDDPLVPSDAIIGLGSYDLRVAERCAEFFHAGIAPTIVLTGKAGHWTSGLFDGSEAEAFAKVCVAAGVPESAILIEPEATNIGENIRFSAALLGAEVRRVVLVTKPQTQRRVRAAVDRQWPQVEALVTAPVTAFEDQPTENHSLDMLIHEMVGDLQRILDYPAKGFAVAQHVPDEVLDAWRFLVAEGFDRHLG